MLGDRESKLLRMKDLLDHMAEAHDQWAWSDEADSELLADLMLRDVEQIKRVCVSLAHQRDGQSFPSAAVAGENCLMHPLSL